MVLSQPFFIAFFQGFFQLFDTDIFHMDRFDGRRHVFRFFIHVIIQFLLDQDVFQFKEQVFRFLLDGQQFGPVVVFFFGQDELAVHVRDQLFLGTEDLFGIIDARRPVIDMELTVLSIDTNTHGVTPPLKFNQSTYILYYTGF